MTSLRRATVLYLAIVLTVLGILGGVAAYLSAMSEASDFLDLQQIQIARYVGDTVPETFGDGAVPPHDPEDDYRISVRAAEGSSTKDSAPGRPMPEASATGFSEFEDDVGRWRVYALVTPDRTVQVAQQVVVRQELANAAAARATLPFILAVPFSWLVVELVARRIFRKLENVAAKVAARDVGDLSPVLADDVPAEVQPLVVAVNDLMQRLRAAMTRQNAFLSDAAHELRTPLTALTLQIANLRQALPGTEESRIAELEAGARRASALAHQLLRIARFDAQAELGNTVPVSLDEVVKEAIAGIVVLADQRSIDLGLVSSESVVAAGTASDFRALIEILVENAVRYTPLGGRVDVTLGQIDGKATLTVEDTGPGVPDGDLPRLVERFFRAAPAAGEGSGLGLAIAKAIADRHGISLTLANRIGQPGFAATLVFRSSSWPTPVMP